MPDAAKDTLIGRILGKALSLEKNSVCGYNSQSGLQTSHLAPVGGNGLILLHQDNRSGLDAALATDEKLFWLTLWRRCSEMNSLPDNNIRSAVVSPHRGLWWTSLK